MIFFVFLLKSLVAILAILVSVPFFTLAERKILSLTGSRLGPNKVSFQGVLQPISDALKLTNKSSNNITNFSMMMYYISATFMLFLTLMVWTIMLSENILINWKFSFLVLMLILGVSAMKSIMAGWSTYSKYSMIGSMRTVSQMISYEAVIYLCMLSMIWMNSSFSVKMMISQEYKFLMIFVPSLIFFWFPSVLAELNRTPYDFSEGESELVSGFNTEFGSSSFTLIFLSEYSNIIFFTTLSMVIFMNPNNNFMILLLVTFSNFWIIWIRSTLPRMRFDKFMSVAWKFYIPTMTLLMCLIIVMM